VTPGNHVTVRSMNRSSAQLSLDHSRAIVLLIGIQVIAFKFSLISSLRLTMFTLLLIWSGSNFIEKTSNKPLTVLEKYSTGFVTGIALLLSVDFFVIRLEISHWFSVLILLLIGYCFRNNGDRCLLNSAEFNSSKSLNHFLIVFSIALLTFNLKALWAIPIAISLLVWTNTTRKRGLSTVLFLTMGLIFLLKYGNNWQLATSNDAGFYESLSWSIIKFGSTDHPGFSGGFAQGPLSSYHTAAYSFSGLASHFSGLKPYEFMNQFGPLVNSFVLASCLMTFLRKKTLGIEIAITAVLVTFILSSGNYNSLTFSLVILFVFVKVNFDMLEMKTLSNLSLFRYVPLFMIGLLAIFSKGTMLLPVFAISAASMAFHISKREMTKNSLKVLAIHTTTVAGFFFFAWWKFLRVDTELGGGISTGSSLWSSLLDIGPYQTFLSHRFRSFTLVSALVVLGLNVSFKKRGQSNIFAFNFWLISSLFVSLFLFISFIPADFRVDEYIVSAHLGLMIVFTCSNNYLRYSEVDAKPRLFNAASIFVGFLLIFVYVPIFRVFMIPRSEDLWGFLTSISPATKVFYFLITENLWLSVFMFGSLVVVFLQISKQVFRRPTSFAISVTLLIPLLSSLSLRADNMTEFFTSRQNSNGAFFISPDGSNSAPNPTSDLLALGDFVRSYTPSNAIFASNNFCCSGENWFNSILNKPTYFGESALGGANYLLPASLQRRFLIQGPRFQINCCIDKFPDHIKRMSLSLKFANNPSDEVLNELKQYSVEFYVVNKSLTNLHSWQDFAKTIYENGEFILLKI
jgi:hypothetical protein